MTPNERFSAVLDRIAVAPNIIRTRRDDAARADRMVDDFDARIEAAVTKLEKVAAELEKSIS